MSKMRFIGAAILSLALVSSSVQAASSIAQVGNFHGKVLINQGKGFIQLKGPLALKAGDSVMIGEQSFATLSYSDCSVSLSAPTVFTVSEVAPCAKGEKLAAVDGAFVAPAADLDPATGIDAAPALLPLLLIGGAAATVGVVVVATKKKHHSSPVSAP